METLLNIDEVLSSSMPDGDNNNNNKYPVVVNDNLDSVIADAMNRLSFDEREKVVHSIHAVLDDDEEEEETYKNESSETTKTTTREEFIKNKLQELEVELMKIKQGESSSDTSSSGDGTQQQQQHLPTAAIELAESISPDFVHDVNLRKKFLRCDKYNPKLAAIRFVKYFDFKFSMFGGSKLCKNITYDDLDKDDRLALEKGFFQWCPERDNGGRPVGIFFPSEQHYNPGCDISQVFGRLMFYHRQMLGNDDKIADRGFVAIFYNVGTINLNSLYRQVPPMFVRAAASLPSNVVCTHFCFSNPLFRILAENTLKIMVGPEKRAAAKIHHGTQQEIRYSLMTYGIPANALPVDPENKLKRQNHLAMLKAVRKREELEELMVAGNGGGATTTINPNHHHDSEGVNNSVTKCSIIPSINDVLFGKGLAMQNRPGNIRLKMTVDKLLPLYNTLDKKGKMELTIQVIETVKERGGDFMSNNKSDGLWLSVPPEMARDKVATLFRNRRKAAIQNEKKKEIQQEQEKQPHSVAVLMNGNGNGEETPTPAAKTKTLRSDVFASSEDDEALSSGPDGTSAGSSSNKRIRTYQV